MTSRRDNKRLTLYQQHVLLVLSTRGEAAAGDWSAWYPMHTSQVYGVLMRLANRGLVDVAGFTDGNARTYKITASGEQLVNEIEDPDAVDQTSKCDCGAGPYGIHRRWCALCPGGHPR